MEIYTVIYKDEDFNMVDYLGTFDDYGAAGDCILNHLSFRGITDEEDQNYSIDTEYSILTSELNKDKTLEIMSLD